MDYKGVERTLDLNKNSDRYITSLSHESVVRDYSLMT